MDWPKKRKLLYKQTKVLLACSLLNITKNVPVNKSHLKVPSSSPVRDWMSATQPCYTQPLLSLAVFITSYAPGNECCKCIAYHLPITSSSSPGGETELCVMLLCVHQTEAYSGVSLCALLRSELTHTSVADVATTYGTCTHTHMAVGGGGGRRRSRRRRGRRGGGERR